MRFFGLVFLMRQHLIGPWWMSSNSLLFFREFAEIFVRGDIRTLSLTFQGLSAKSQNFPRIYCGKACLSADYTAERHAFLGYNSRKVKTFHPFRGIIRGKACNCELFCVKADLSMVKSMESFYFSHTILRKGMPFCRIIRRKSKLPAYYTAEKHDFPRKVKTFRELSCGKFQYTAESQNLTL